MNLPPPSTIEARHVLLVIAHGMNGDLPPLSELPNVKTLRRLGASIDHCVTHGRSALQTLLLDGDGGGLAGAADRGGRRLLQILPWRPASWVAGATRAPHWSVIHEGLDETTDSWEDLLQSSPRVVFDNGDGAGAADGDDVGAFLRNNVVARFPGAQTMLQEDIGPLEAWMNWVSDAFLRGLWYASSRWQGGLVGVLCHPAPGLLARRDPAGGYLQGLAMVDDLIGRLLVLAEHRELDGSAVVLCGDGVFAHGGTGPGGNGDASSTPVMMVAPGLDAGRRGDGADLAEVAAWLRDVASRPADDGLQEPR